MKPLFGFTEIFIKFYLTWNVSEKFFKFIILPFWFWNLNIVFTCFLKYWAAFLTFYHSFKQFSSWAAACLSTIFHLFVLFGIILEKSLYLGIVFPDLKLTNRTLNWIRFHLLLLFLLLSRLSKYPWQINLLTVDFIWFLLKILTLYNFRVLNWGFVALYWFCASFCVYFGGMIG